MKIQHAALLLAFGMASGSVIADRLSYRSSVQIPIVDRTDAQEEIAMAKVARISLEQARAIAQKAVPQGRISEAELDNEDGNVVYEIEVMLGKQERSVIVDAGNGAILSNTLDQD